MTSNPDMTVGQALPPSPEVIVPLRRLPLWSSSLTLLTTFAAAFTTSAAVDLVPRLWRGTALPADITEALAVAGFWSLVVGGVVAKRFIVRLKPPAPIVFHERFILLPPSAEALRQRAVPYSEIMSVNEGGAPPRRQFFIESKRHVFHLPQGIFMEPDGPERLFVELRRRILSLPQGAALIEQTELRRIAALRAMASQPLATQGLLGLIAVFFGNTYLKGALEPGFGLVRWGANVPVLVRDGELFRLVAANFLHSSIPHVLMNGLALYYLGTLLERLLGWPRFLLLYLTCGLVAMGASAYAGGALLSVGASGAIFGLLGAFGVVSWRMRAQLPLGLRQPLRWWVFIIVINALLPLLLPVAIDVTAHLAGAVCGVAMGLALVYRRGTPALPPPAGRPLQAAALVLALAYLGGLVQAVYQAASAPPDAEARFTQQVVDDPRTPASSLNDLAWVWALDPGATAEQLTLADRAVRKALRLEPDVPAILDTSATVDARLGKFDRAVATERRVLAAAPDDPLYTSQLTRFLAARLHASGPMVVPELPARAVHLAVDKGAGQLVIEAFPELDSGAAVVALLYSGERLVGLAQASVGAHARPPMRVDEALVRRGGTGDEPMRLELALAELSRDAIAAGTASWHVVPVVHLK